MTIQQHPDGLEPHDYWTVSPQTGATEPCILVCPICRKRSKRSEGTERIVVASDRALIDPRPNAPDRTTYAAWTCSDEHAEQWRASIQSWKDDVRGQ